MYTKLVIYWFNVPTHHPKLVISVLSSNFQHIRQLSNLPVLRRFNNVWSPRQTTLVGPTIISMVNVGLECSHFPEIFKWPLNVFQKSLPEHSTDYKVSTGISAELDFENSWKHCKPIVQIACSSSKELSSGQIWVFLNIP